MFHVKRTGYRCSTKFHVPTELTEVDVGTRSQYGGGTHRTAVTMWSPCATVPVDAYMSLQVHRFTFGNTDFIRSGPYMTPGKPLFHVSPSGLLPRHSWLP